MRDEFDDVRKSSPMLGRATRIIVPPDDFVDLGLP